MDANNFRIDQTVYHVNLHNGQVAFKVVGIRATELELEDIAPNENNTVSMHGWQPIAGIRYGKQRTPDEETKWQEWCERNKERVKQGLPAMLPQHFKG